LGQEVPSDLTYREEELLELYEDLLALPDDEAKVTADSSARVSTQEQDRAVVEAIVSRLSPSPSALDPSDAFSALLHQRAASDSPHIPARAQPHAHETGLDNCSATLPHRVALNLLTPITQELTAIRNAHTPSSAKAVPLALLSVEEWRSLTRVCVRICRRNLPIEAERKRHTSLLTMIPAQLNPLLNS